MCQWGPFHAVLCEPAALKSRLPARHDIEEENPNLEVEDALNTWASSIAFRIDKNLVTI